MIYVLLLIYTHVVAIMTGATLNDRNTGPLWESVVIILFWPVFVAADLFSVFFRRL